jgi:imidazolonepropionase-like amidohydrolase
LTAATDVSSISATSAVPINFLIHQATFAVKEGLDRETALRAVTINPARIVGVADRPGSIEPGKDADLCLWSGDPLDVMNRVERAYVDGQGIYRVRRVVAPADLRVVTVCFSPGNSPEI